MLIQAFLLLAILLVTALCDNHTDILHLFSASQDEIESTMHSCWGWAYDGAIKQFIQNNFQKHFKNYPIIINNLCLSYNELGNKLGYYLNNIACAEIIGAHFFTVRKHYEYSPHSPAITRKQLDEQPMNPMVYEKALFFESLPHIRLHAHPQNISTAKSLADIHCGCTRTCWLDATAPWVQQIDLIGQVLRTAIDRYVDVTDAMSAGTVVDVNDMISRNLTRHPHAHHHGHSQHHSPHAHAHADTAAATVVDGRRRLTDGSDSTHTIPHIIEASTRAGHHPHDGAHLHQRNGHLRYNSTLNRHSSRFLPLIPTVAIHYRCGDNIAFSDMYGVSSFLIYNKTTILRNGLMEDDIKTIYILTEPIQRSSGFAPCPTCCTFLLEHLLTRMMELFPKAIVLVKRGGNVFLDYARLAYSPIVFCSASTFCMWPAIANQKGLVYLPYTALIAGAVNASTAPHLGKNIEWIDGHMTSAYPGSPELLLEAVMTPRA